MVICCNDARLPSSAVSVLALSSRFDGQKRHRIHALNLKVSVLALSSRFDGRRTKGFPEESHSGFSTRSVESF